MHDAANIEIYFKDRLDALVRTTSELAAFESPSTDLKALRRTADEIMRRINEICDGRAQLVRVGREHRPLVRLDLGERPDVVYIGHFDTVHPIGALERSPVELEGHHLYGPGTMDMKGGIAAMIELARWLCANDEHPNVTMLFTADEEIGSSSSGPYLREVSADAKSVLIFDYGDETGALRNGARGVRFVRMTLIGHGGHAAYPERHCNPVASLGRVIEFAATLHDPDNGICVTPTRVAGSEGTNVVPDVMEIGFDIRGSSEASITAVVEALSSFRLDDTEITVNADVLVNVPTFEVSEANEAVKLAHEAYEQLGWEVPDMVEARGASDANQVAPVTPHVLDGFGGWGNGAHSPSEYLDVNSLPYCAALAAMITRLALDPRD